MSAATGRTEVAPGPRLEDLTLDGFVAWMQAAMPGRDLSPDTPIDGLQALDRLVVRRRLADLFDQPTDLDVLRAMDTLRSAWDWVREGLDRGERLRAPATRRRASTSRLRLRPLGDADLGPLYEACFDPATADRWRFRGRTASPEEFVSGLHAGVRAQFVVEIIETGRAVGLVSAYDHDPRAQHCKVAFVRFAGRESGDGGAMIEGLALLAGHLFRTFPYRKLYAELPAFNLGLMSEGFVEDEAVLREHCFHDGELVDLHILSITRRRWEALEAVTGW
jgi:RimJ/RimL family protein N-acetyltransferase